MVSELIEKYVWLVQTLIEAGHSGLTFEQLQSRWERRFYTPYARRTFNNHREAVEAVFGIWIECRRSDNTYYIDGGRDVLDKDKSLGWMISTFTVGSLLSMGRERLSGRVSLENIPSGQLYLAPVMSAMTELQELSISYAKYGAEPESIHVHPYAVKEFQSRWYLIGHCVERKALRLYGLDRILALEPSGRRFTLPADFSVEDLFYRSFGPYLTSSADEVQTITFKAFGTDALYLRDLPLHHTQTVVSESPSETVFSVNLVPNRNFYMELCRYGPRIEVLSPEPVRQKLAEELRLAYERYK